jgi:FAD binding domain/Berberine and berberine like
MATRREFVKNAGVAMVAGLVGFPARSWAYADNRASPRVTGQPPSGGETPSVVASNGYLASLLPSADLIALRNINVSMTRLAIEQCARNVVANQILFDTLICEALTSFAAHDVSPEDLLGLSAQYDVVFLWSLAYGNVRTTLNARFVRFPLAVAFPRTVQEVAFWVNFVREHQFSVSIRSGNNCYESFSIDNEIVIDLTFLTVDRTDQQFVLDSSAGVVHAAAGVRLGVLYTALAKSGVTVAGGQCSPVCLGGLVGTGGVGFSTRTFGYVCDQLVEAECVLADGSIVVANASNQYADLFRAIKGAGAAGLAVITRFTMAVVPAVTVLFYTVTFNLGDAAIVLDKWQNLAATAPNGLSSVANLTATASGSPGPNTFFINGEFRVDQGSVMAAEAQLKNVLQTHWLNQLPEPLNQTAIEIEALTAVEAATTLALEVPQPILNQWKLKSNFVFNQLEAAALQPIVDFLLTHAPSDDLTTGVGALTILLLGGTANTIDPNSAVVPARNGAVSWFQGGALWNDQSLEPQALAFVDELFAVLDPILQSHTAQYGVPDLQLGSQLTTPPNLNYLQAYWSGPTLNFVPFLVGVKQKYDPQDLFRFAQSIPVNL